MTIAFLLRDWDSIGGIQKFASQFCRAVMDAGHCVYPITVQCDPWRWWKRYDLIIIGHVHLLPLTLLLPWGAVIWLMIYGIELQKPLTFWQRLGLWRVQRVVGISNYTVQQAKPFLGEKVYAVLRCMA